MSQQAGRAGQWGMLPAMTTLAAPTLHLAPGGSTGPQRLPAHPSPTKTTIPELPSLCDVVWAGFLRKRGTGRGIWIWLVELNSALSPNAPDRQLLLSSCKFKLKGTYGLAVVCDTEINLLCVISVLGRWEGEGTAQDLCLWCIFPPCPSCPLVPITTESHNGHWEPRLFPASAGKNRSLFMWYFLFKVDEGVTGKFWLSGVRGWAFLVATRRW